MGANLGAPPNWGPNWKDLGGHDLCSGGVAGATALQTSTHSGRFLADETIEVLKKLGPEKFVAIVTDNAANMVKMRRHIVEDPACAHLIPLRCMMHAFGLVIGSLLGHKRYSGKCVQVFLVPRSDHPQVH
ncbi:hypothetical protein WJX82_004484 [Trebouxia sp. C0006]